MLLVYLSHEKELSSKKGKALATSNIYNIKNKQFKYLESSVIVDELTL